ncbi:hypothetical protein PDESU_02627 [Pontiella desulfatans]|uniref:Uncharacterized protein n=1 Tax=Pontiella desulfatans TaxID=2750659 RepID=A0A6C2U257_PONDE|nr:hypothetical protein [Pontiella desulfatans]VGO14070.1 hypothetical protein PDESU_02627 [Pontiella desulfatans]
MHLVKKDAIVDVEDDVWNQVYSRRRKKSNRIYTAEYSTNLVSGSWFPMAESQAGNGSVIAVADINNLDNCFYRVKAKH